MESAATPLGSVVPLHYGYLLGAVLFCAVWVALFLWRRSVRREMLMLSFFSLFLGFTQSMFVGDYWRPESIFGNGTLDVESFILAFCYGGVAAPLYELVHWRSPNYSPKAGNVFFGIAAAIFGVAATLAGIHIFGWNSIYASSAALIVVGITMVAARSRLWKHALYTGVLFAILMFTVLEILELLIPGIIASWWRLENLSGVMIADVPLEEFVSAFSWGFFAGPASELAAKLRLNMPKMRSTSR